MIVLALRQPRSKRVTQEVEPLVLMSERAVVVLAVHDARLVRMQLQTDLRHPFGECLQHVMCLGLGLAVNDRVIGLCRGPDYAEDRVGWQQNGGERLQKLGIITGLRCDTRSHVLSGLAELEVDG